VPAELYEFGDVTVDFRRVEVRRAGAVVPLEPKSFDVLRQLLENRDRLVTKDELLDVVWKDTFVTPNVLTRAVAQLRKGLGDDAFEARYIETVAKRGYRFVAPVSARDGSEGASTARPQKGASGEMPTPDAPRTVRPPWLALVVAALVIAGVAAATREWLGSRGRPSASEEGAPLTPRRLTSTRGSDYTPAISSDGSAVAYGSARAGRQEIYVAGLAPGSRELAITSDGGGNSEPEFSPDGQWLAYRSGTPGGIWVVPAMGGTPRRVADFGSQPSWSPDSRTIVFSTRAGLSSQAVLWTVHRDGTALAQLTRLGSPPGGHAVPTWSRDGRLIAFMVGRHEEREIWTMPARGGAPRRITRLTRFSEPRFAPDDRALYWLGLTEERNDCLMRVRLSPRGEAVGDPERVLTFQGEGVGSLSIARDGRAVFDWHRRSVNLFAVDVDAHGRAAGPPRQLTFDEDATNRYAHYSPDGRIAYEQLVAGRPVSAWVMDEDGGNPLPLSAGLTASARIPQWEPGGRRVFTVVEPGRDGPAYYAWIDLATRELSRIPVPSAGVANMPSLSPDGRQLAYHLVGADGIVNVWVQPLDGGAPRQVTFDREAISYPRWSLDGERLVVHVKRGEDSQVGVVSLKDGRVEQLTSDRGILFGYASSPDAEWIAFSRGPRDKEDSVVYTVSRRTRELNALSNGRFPAFSPRGNRIAFSHAERTASLWTVRLPSSSP
jgi:Tol biopolymer transport system component/DNA-binding winged helix-turn-helix (wHTH) protein